MSSFGISYQVEQWVLRYRDGQKVQLVFNRGANIVQGGGGAPSGGAGGFLSGSYPNPGVNTEALHDAVGAMAGTGLSYDDDTGRINADGGGGGAGDLLDWQIVHKTVAETLNSSTALQNDDDLLFAIGANQRWLIEFHLLHRGDPTPDVKFALSTPSGATVSYTSHGPRVNDAVMTAVPASTADDTALPQGNIGTTSSSVLLTKMYADVTCGATPGNVTLRWAQNVSSGGNTTVEAGSYLIARRIA